MAKKEKLPTELKNPFSEEFMVAWEYWKKFKKEQFRFSYKPIGEQHAIDDLFEISNGDEQVAKLIIKQSLAKGWHGLFALKNDTNGKPASAKAPTREDVITEFASRDYNNRGNQPS